MDNLNYCRQMTKSFHEMLSRLRGVASKAGLDDAHEKEVRIRMQNAIDLANRSKKFLLPKGGTLFDDDELRALDENGRLSLPFDFVALEFDADSDAQELALSSTQKFTARKRIIFARHVEDKIVCTQVFCVDRTGNWASFHDFAIPRTGAIGETVQRQRAVTILTHEPDNSDNNGVSHDANVVVSFLNAISCANVHIKRSEPKRTGRKVKSALPFDTYHILTVDVGRRGDYLSSAVSGTHRSPREHLRRGHIRRLADGRRVWVNATVVGAGKGAGTVKKDYKLRQA